MYKRLPKNQYTPWLLGAVTAPVIQAASNCSWPVVLAVGTLCLGIALGMEHLGITRLSEGWIGAIQWLWMLLVMGEYLHWIMYCWPFHDSYHVLPLTMLALAAVTLRGGWERTSRTAGILLWFLVGLLGAVLLSAMPQVKPENLYPDWKMQTAHLVPVMLLPVMGLGIGTAGKKQWILYGGLGVSAITTGVLTSECIRTMEAPFYEMSRSLKLLGIGQRFESLVAALMLLGYYVLLTFLLAVTANAWGTKAKGNREVWVSALFVGMIFCSGMRLNSRLLAAGTLVIWAVLPILKNFPKFEKSA